MLIIDDSHVMEMVKAYKGIEIGIMHVKAMIGPINLNKVIESARNDGMGRIIEIVSLQ